MSNMLLNYLKDDGQNGFWSKVTTPSKVYLKLTFNDQSNPLQPTV